MSPSVIASLLGAVAVLLVLASIAGQLAKFVLGHEYLEGLVPLFYVDNEFNIPTLFSVLLMLFSAVLLAVITLLSGRRRAPHVSKWAILSIGFFLMACDEGLQYHERLILPIRALLGDSDLGIYYFAWVIPGIALVLVSALFFMRFLLHLPTATRLRFMMAATLYIGGVIGMELFAGRLTELDSEVHTSRAFFLPLMITTVEESLEMAGVIIFIWALLVYIADTYKEVRFRFEGVRGEVTIDDPQRPSK